MVNITSWDDAYRQYAPEAQHSPAVQITFYDKPIVLERYRTSRGEDLYRISVWMPGEAGRTKPLVEERFTYDDFHHAVKEVLRTATLPQMYPPVGKDIGYTELFMLEWAKTNWRTVEDAEDRRSSNSSAFTDLGMHETTANIPTRTFVGEDGKTYHELDLRGEDTDPVLLEATRDRDRILAAALEAEKREKAEAERIRQEAAERKEREQAEFESLPGFGSF